MSTQNRAERPPLDPPSVELGRNFPGHVSANVMTPIPVSDVCSRCSEFRLEGQRFPNRHNVPGEPDLIAMIPESTPPVEEQRAIRFPAFHVCEKNIVEPPGRRHAGNFRRSPRLPVQPPEIDALMLKRVNDQVHVVRGKLLVDDIERNVFLRCRIDSHRRCHFRIMIFVRLDAGGRMKVQWRLQSFTIAPGKEALGIRKVVPVPRVSGPSERLTCLIFRRTPPP